MQWLLKGLWWVVWRICALHLPLFAIISHMCFLAIVIVHACILTLYRKVKLEREVVIFRRGYRTCCSSISLKWLELRRFWTRLTKSTRRRSKTSNTESWQRNPPYQLHPRKLLHNPSQWNQQWRLNCSLFFEENGLYKPIWTCVSTIRMVPVVLWPNEIFSAAT